MKLTAKHIGDVLEATLGYRVLMNPYGFELQNAQGERARLRSGSGIAGNSYRWTLVRLPAGEPIVWGIDTKTKLVRAALEFMAGPKPTELSDYTVPRAKRVISPRTGESRFVWCRRKKKRSRPSLTKRDPASGWPGLASQGDDLFSKKNS